MHRTLMILLLSVLAVVLTVKLFCLFDYVPFFLIKVLNKMVFNTGWLIAVW